MKSAQVLICVVMHGRVVDVAGRAPVLAHRVLVARVPRLVERTAGRGCEVGELRTCRAPRADPLAPSAGCTTRWAPRCRSRWCPRPLELGDRLLVRVVDVERDVARRSVDDVGVVVLGPGVDVELPSAAGPPLAPPRCRSSSRAAARGEERAGRGARGEPEEAPRLRDWRAGLAAARGTRIRVVSCVACHVGLLLSVVKSGGSTVSSSGSDVRTSMA